MIQHATHHHQPASSAYDINPGVWARGRNVIAFIALVSWVACLAGYLTNPARFFQSYLVGFLFAVTIPLGGLFFVMIQYLTGSAWSVPMRRIAENLVVTIFIGVLLFIPVALGIYYLYPWTNSALMLKDEALRGKAAYLSPQWFYIRAAIYFLIWSLWSWRIYANSTKQDRTYSLDQMHAISRWSAPGLLVITLSVSLAAFDWSMSLEPKWYSTMFGLYVFAGGAFAFMAVWTLICLMFRSKGILSHTINVEHYHDLGKWMFALTIFWAYLAFSQYMLIWYANIPEETIYFRHRMEGSWAYWSAFLVLGHFVVPFMGLVTRASKRNLQTLTVMALWIVAMHFVDIYWQVMPTFQTQGIDVSWLDFVCPIAVTSVFALIFWFRVKAHKLLPIGDPRFEKGLHFENA